MDVVLLTLTTLSLTAAAGFGFLSWRVGREERQREQARVAALATAMTGPSAVRVRDETAPQSILRGFGETGPRLGGAFPLESHAAETQVAVGSVFDRATEGLRGRPAIKAAVAAAMVVTIVIGAIIGARLSDNSAASTTSTRHEAAATNTPAPLELMSMRHQCQG